MIPIETKKALEKELRAIRNHPDFFNDDEVYYNAHKDRIAEIKEILYGFKPQNDPCWLSAYNL